MRNIALTDASAPVVFFANALGDHLINRPALAALSAFFEGRLTLLARRGFPQIFFPDIPFARVIEQPFDCEGGARRFDAAEAARSIGACDLFLSLNPWHSPEVDRLLTELAPARSVGFFDGFSTRLLLDFGKHSVDLAFDVARVLQPGARADDYSASLPLCDADRDLARRIRARIGPRRRLLVVHNETKPEKQWSAQRVAELLSLFLERVPQYVAIVVGERQSMVDAGPWIEAVGMDLRSALGLIAEADLFLGVDSLWLHAADLCRVPGVGIFGPTSAREFGFRFCPAGSHLQGDGTTAAISVQDALSHLLRAHEAATGMDVTPMDVKPRAARPPAPR